MKNGFTLIELLAVIVILAIIALIATPIVLNIINESKESARLRSAEMYLDAVEQSISVEKMNNTKFNPNECTITDKANLECDTKDGILEVKVNGDKPLNGSITFENGKIKDVSLEYSNGKTIVKNDKGQLQYKKEETDGPVLLEGDGSTYSTIAINDLQFRSSANYNEFKEVKVNGVTVDPKYYTVSEGSTIINLSGQYLVTLEAGVNEIAIVSDSGSATGTFSGYEGIPKGCTYTVKATGEVLTLGQSVPSTPAQGDIYRTEDYEFHYMQMKSEDSSWYDVTEEELEYVANQYANHDVETFFGKWFFSVIDETKESYGEIPTILFGEANKNLSAVFVNCTNLKYSPQIPSSATNMIGTFSNCSSLLEIPKLPEDVYTYRTFENCDSLMDIVIPEGLERIGTKMFSECNNLTSIYIPSSVSIIDTEVKSDRPFYNCSSSLKIYTEVKEGEIPLGWGPYWNYYSATGTLEVIYGVTREEYEAIIAG